MASSTDLKAIFAEARPLIEQQLDLAELVVALRDAATDKGLDWSQIKALLKAQIQDERDDKSDGKRVKAIVAKAEHASAYADMLGLAKMNEIIFSPHSSEPTSSPVETDKAETVSIAGEPPAVSATPSPSAVHPAEAGAVIPSPPAAPADPFDIGDIPEFLRRTDGYPKREAA